MLLTTHTGILVNSAHVAFIGLRKDAASQSAGIPERTTHRILLRLGSGESVIAARGLPLQAARFVREDIATSWEAGKARWKASESLKRLAEGAYFSAEESEDDLETDLTESEEDNVE